MSAHSAALALVVALGCLCARPHALAASDAQVTGEMPGGRTSPSSAASSSSPTTVHSPVLPRTVRVVNGRVAGSGVWVGLYTSQLQVKVVDAMFPAVSEGAARNVSLANATVLRYLDLEGAYWADTPLLLPNLFVLRIAAASAITVAPNATTPDGLSAMLYPAVVGMYNSLYSGVVGGLINATGSQYQAVRIEGGAANLVRNVTARSSSKESIISVYQGSRHEVAGCDTGYNPTGRCIWTLATRSAVVHHNHVHHCRAHALDFDAYTSYSAAFANTCEYNGEEGIFVEETASYNVVSRNVCRFNGHGIGVYSNAVGPVQHNTFIENTVTNNTGGGISSGGFGHRADKYAGYNVFAGNVLAGNGAGVDPTHGPVVGDFWVANDNQDGWARIAASMDNVTIFEP